jgi:hypothetical protein
MSRATGSLLALGSSWAAYKVSDEHVANDEHAQTLQRPRSRSPTQVSTREATCGRSNLDRPPVSGL